MITIIQRYLVIEILKSTVATTLILFIILMSNTLGRVLSDISEGKTPVEALFPVFLGQSIHILSLLLPLGFFLGIIFAFGRLYKDHELVVLHACGFGYRHLYTALSYLLVPIFLLSMSLSLWLSAEFQQRAIKIVDEKESNHEFQRLKVGQFNQSNQNDSVFFMQSMSEDKLEIQNIIISQPGQEQDVLQTAKTGRHKLDEKNGDLFLEVGPGIRYVGKAGQADYQIIEFEKHGILIKKKPAKTSPLDSDEISFSDLIQSHDLNDRVEFWWRISIPVTLVILALLAVPLSYIAPRQGRYGKIGLSLLVFIIYLNLLGLTKSALEEGQLPLWLNFWWVHVIFMSLTILLMLRRIHPLFLSNR
ncbi:MAG: LPS export ABC transporter permease LptF [Gammaproteobacteria bacterium]|nr:LPS export ABC transporter permease LptF [Gammaproteobacteria bacterium]